MTNKIYCFVDGKFTSGDLNVVALAADGHCLAGHISSNEWFARHDIGIGSDWKHDRYNAHYPDGWELEWVDDPVNHAGCQAAIALNAQLPDPDAEGAI